MKISEIFKPTPDLIVEAKKSYNRLLQRENKAADFLNNPDVPASEKDRHILSYRIEIIEPLENYLQVLKAWGVQIDDAEILGGMKIDE